MKRKKRLGEMLITLGFLTNEQLQSYIGNDVKTDQELSELLVNYSVITKEQLKTIFEYQFGVPYVELGNYTIQPHIPKLVPERLARRHHLIPIDVKENNIIVAMEDPQDIMAIDDVRIMTGYEVEPVISFSADILHLIDSCYDSSEVVEQVFDEIMESSRDEESTDYTESDEVAKSPVVRLVNTIMGNAIKMRASDVHIEPREKNLRIRFRIDGELKEVMAPPKNSYAAIIARIKIMGGMNISEKRLPQDGRVETDVNGRKVDMRISILPSIHGEKIVIRILDRSSILLTKEKIGFSPHNIQLFDKMIKVPEGIILVTGPTGSGKTTTMYAVLRELNKPTVNIISAEDPVEYHLDGINQVQVNEKSGLTFAATLRAILRQDPDVIMVGEIRDAETAQTAVQAAITGHVVLSTLHTNDTASTIDRLLDMGIETFLVSSALTGVVAQRLAKRVCLHCKQAMPATNEELVLLGIKERFNIYRGKGCNACGGTGYSGRIGIHEVLVIDKELRSMISKGMPTEAIKEAAIKKGMKTLKASCRDLIIQGITTPEELLRVAYSLE